MLYHNFVHDLPYFWNWNGQELGIPKPGFCARKNLLPTCAFGPSCEEYLSHCPLPLAPCHYTPLAPLYLILTHFEQEATGHHAKPREAEILCRDGLARSVRLK